MTTLVCGGTVVTMDEQRRILPGADVLIGDDGCVADVGPGLAAPPGCAVVDAGGSLVLPGLINAHTHTFQTLMRGLGDGLPFHQWQREVTYPLYQALTPEDAYIFSLVGCVENIRSGVTAAINFQAYPNSAEAVAWVARAFREAGLSGILVQSFFGSHAPPGLRAPSLAAVLAAAETSLVTVADDPLLKLWLGPPLPTQAPPDWIVAAHELAARYGAGLHVHISESEALAAEARARLGGKGEIEFLDDLGVVDARFQAAHCVGISEAEMRIMAERGAHVLHCPESNMYLGSGIARIERMHELGLNVALGTDGPATNNNQDMFAAMKAAALLQKVAHLNPAALPTGTALEMATLAGARALGRSDLGRIVPGARADLAVVRMRAAHTVAVNRPVSSLVFTAAPADVQSVFVAGRPVLLNGGLQLVDEEALLAEAEARALHILRRAGREHLRELHWPWA